MAARRLGRPVRVHMDLGGPKLRTGPITGGLPVVKLQPGRDALGQVIAKARLGLRPAGSTVVVEGAAMCLGASAGWLKRLKDGDAVEQTDARGSHRSFTVVRSLLAGALLECAQTAYLTSETRLRIHRKGRHALETALADIPLPEGKLRLQRGQLLNLVDDGMGHGPVAATKGRRAQPATIACTLPEALARVRKGQRIWFDDGRIGGVVLRAGASRVQVEITEARDGGENLAADKGINLPDTRLDLPALTAKDLLDLDVVAKHADVVGLSFAQSASDVHALRQHLRQRGAPQLGLMLNKGPHILDAMRTLDDILRRMQTHQSKKRSMLRALKAWKLPDHPPAGVIGSDMPELTTHQKETAP